MSSSQESTRGRRFPAPLEPGSWFRRDVDLAGLDLDFQQGPPLRVHLSADSEPLLGPGPRSWALDSLPVTLEVQLGHPGKGVLTVDVIASTCEGDVCTIRRNTVEHALTVS